MKNINQIIKVVLSFLFIILVSNCEDATVPPGTAGGVVALPEFSVDSGTYTAGFNVAVTCATENAVIYYSTDGFNLDGAYSELTGNVNVSGHTTICVYAAADGMENSDFNRCDYAIIADDTGNLLGNGDFHKGETLWYVWNSEDLNAVSENSFASEAAFLDIESPGDEPWATGLVYCPDFLMENGRIYSLTFDASASVPRTITVSVGERGRDLNNNGSVYDKYLEESFNLTTDMQSYASEIEMTNPTDDAVEFAFHAGKYSGDVTIDNVYFSVRDPRLIDPSAIPDPNLKQAIADTADITVAEIGQLNETSLEVLNALEYGIADLTGINQFTSMKSLRLWANEISNLGPIVGMKQLEYLHLYSNPIDFASLSVMTYENFPNLIGLFLDAGTDLIDNRAGIIDILLEFPRLNVFGLTDFSLTDAQFGEIYAQVLEPSLDRFSSLCLQENVLTNASLSLVANLDVLHILIINENPITDISALIGHSGLFQLELSGTSVTDLQPLKTLYDSGAFQMDENYIDVEYLGLDLTSGTDNRAVVDYLLGNGVTVEWENGNTVD